MNQLMVTEIFNSIQGESTFAGQPCSFVRLTGCPLRCRWCDTAYSFHGGTVWSFEQILEELGKYPTRLVELTGGEPLAQKESLAFMQRLLDTGYTVLIETGGSESIEGIPKEVRIIMDLKCPASKMHERMHWANLAWIKTTDELKFVIAEREDFIWAEQKIQELQLESKATLLFSAAWGLVTPEQLTRWLLDSGLKARLNLQLHKYIWGPRKRGV